MGNSLLAPLHERCSFVAPAILHHPTAFQPSAGAFSYSNYRPGHLPGWKQICVHQPYHQRSDITLPSSWRSMLSSASCRTYTLRIEDALTVEDITHTLARCRHG